MLFSYHIRVKRTHPVPVPPDHSVSQFILVPCLIFLLHRSCYTEVTSIFLNAGASAKAKPELREFLAYVGARKKMLMIPIW